MPTKANEREFETTVVRDMTGGGWNAGKPEDFDREFAIDAPQLFAFLQNAQAEEWKKLGITPDDKNCPERRKFLARIDGELNRRGVVDVLKNGINHENAKFRLYYTLPSEDNEEAKADCGKNRFSVTRQLKFCQDTEESLDLAMFINGLPVVTAELKNHITGQTANDAVEQYRLRNAKLPLFRHGRCAVHFAVDDYSVLMCTHLQGGASDFNPFDKGGEKGAGNPPNPDGFATDYLWKEVLRPRSLSGLVEHYARRLQDGQQIWPRYHQRDAVEMLLARAQQEKAEKKYLVQHSAGSGKSKTIAWLAHRLAELYKGREEVFASVLVVSNRRVLDGQLQRDIRAFSGDDAIVGHAETAAELRRHIENRKKVIVTTIQKFPFILKELKDQGGKKFAVIIDEAHAGQTGKAAAQMSAALGGKEEAGDMQVGAESNGEDEINKEIETRINSRRMPENASYFAFTATPKAKTLELFGEPQKQGADGKIPYKPHHAYWMKQAIAEGYILDVLAHYTPVLTFLKIVKTVKEDPVFDRKRAQKKLRRFVERNPDTIAKKAEIIVEHFYGNIDRNLNGQARAMVVCKSILAALDYHSAINKILGENGNGHRAMVAFSGEQDYRGEKVTEAKLNGCPEQETPAKFRETETARFLVCANKFQVGYDEPLLQVMYVDKPLSDVLAVQTLSRINRKYPQKDICMVLDFCNSLQTIEEAFQDYYQTTNLSDKADPNKLHDLKNGLDQAGVYGAGDVENIVNLFLREDDRAKLEAVLNQCREKYLKLGEAAQVTFKGDAKAFCRFYEFIALVLPYNMEEWEKLSIFLNLLIPKLPSPVDEDTARGILEMVDLDSYRVRKLKERRVELQEEDGNIVHPAPEEGGVAEEEKDPLSVILQRFNEKFFPLVGNKEVVAEIWQWLQEAMPEVRKNEDYKNALRNTPDAAYGECETALREVKLAMGYAGRPFPVEMDKPEVWDAAVLYVYDETKKD